MAPLFSSRLQPPGHVPLTITCSSQCLTAPALWDWWRVLGGTKYAWWSDLRLVHLS
jgi:hypothetical protein